MLQKVYLYHHDREKMKVEIIYIESKNFNFNRERVFNRNFQPIQIPHKLFSDITHCILNDLHFGGHPVYTDAKTDIQLGRMIETPEHLIEEE